MSAARSLPLCESRSPFLIVLLSRCHCHHPLRGHTHCEGNVDSNTVTGCIVMNTPVQIMCPKAGTTFNWIRSNAGRLQDESTSTVGVELPPHQASGDLLSHQSLLQMYRPKTLSVFNISTTHVLTTVSTCPRTASTTTRGRI